MSLNLPAAIEDLAGDRIPASLQEKAAKVRRMGGIEHLTALTNDLPALLQRNKEILDEVRVKEVHQKMLIIRLSLETKEEMHCREVLLFINFVAK